MDYEYTEVEKIVMWMTECGATDEEIQEALAEEEAKKKPAEAG